MSTKAIIPDHAARTAASKGKPSTAATDGFAEEAPRIVHVCTRFAQGGSEQRLRDMLVALPDHEHCVIVGGGSDLDLARRRLPNATVLLEPSLQRSVSPRHDLTAFVRLRRLIKQGGWALVVTHQSKAGVLGRLAARTAGSPPVVHSLSMADFGSGYGIFEGSLFRMLEWSLARWTAAYAVVGTDLAARFSRIGVPKDRLQVIRSAVRLPYPGAPRSDVREEVARTYDLPEDRPWILYVGSLDHRKNVLDLPILLQQALQLCVEEPPFLVVAGAGPLSAQLQSLSNQMGVADDIRLLGYVEDPGPLFVAADAVVLLSRAEGLPQVLVQAAAAGTPFVTTDVDGADELLELGASGSVVGIGDVVGAARALLPYLRWRTERRGAALDLSSWRPDRVQADYRGLFGTVLATPNGKPHHAGRVVAVVGSDGSGKSTLCRALAESLSENQRVVPMYLGSGDGPSSLIRWPLTRVKRAVFGAKGSAARKQAVASRAPGALAASRSVWALALAFEKNSKLRRAGREVRRGALVLSDRYPQIQFAGTTDGPLLDSWAGSESRWRRKLAGWERKPYQRAHELQPDLVIRLHVSQDTAIRRRPGHDPATLKARRQVVKRLRFDHSRFGVVEIDANRPFEAVLADARSAVAACVTEPYLEAT